MNGSSIGMLEFLVFEHPPFAFIGARLKSTSLGAPESLNCFGRFG